MNIYLAARYTRRLELCSYRKVLECLGHRVTCRWLDGSHQLDSSGKTLGDDGELKIEEGDPCAMHFATEDRHDVYMSDLVIAFTEEPRSGHSRGGRHVELGLAIARNKSIIVVGPRENVFCWLPEIEWYPDWFTALAALAESSTVSRLKPNISK